MAFEKGIEKQLVFIMADCSGNELRGLTLSSQISKDGNSFDWTTNSPSEISDGFYKLTVTSDEMIADVVAIMISGKAAPNAVQQNLIYYTESVSSQINYLKNEIDYISSQSFPSGDIINHGDDGWVTGTGGGGGPGSVWISSQLLAISSLAHALPSSDAIDNYLTTQHGAGNWTTGVGGGSGPGSDFISSQLNFISSQIIGISSQIKGVETHGDSEWITATGFTTTADLEELESEMDYVSSQVGDVFASGDIIRRGDEAWITAVGFSTHSADDVDTQLTSTHGGGSWEGLGGSSWISSQLTAISSNTVEINKDTDYISGSIFPSGDIIAHGDDNWITAVGFVTASDLNELETEMDYVSSQIFNINNDIDYISSQSFASGSIISHGNNYWKSSNINDIPTNVDTELTSNHGAGSWTTGVGGAGGGTAFISSQLNFISSQIVGVSSQIDGVESHGDSNWTTAIGFATPADLDELEAEVDYISSQIFPSGDIINHGDDHWTTGVGGSSGGPGSVWISSQLLAISSNTVKLGYDTDYISSQTYPSSAIIDHGDSYWKSSNISNLSTHSAADIWTVVSRTLTDDTSVIDWISSQVINIFPSSAIITHGDRNWTTGAGGGGGGSNFISSQLNFLSSNSFPSSSIIVHGDSNWSAAGTDVTPYVSYISSQITWASSQGRWFPSSAIITHGDTFWSAGGGTAVQDMVSYISTQTTWISSQLDGISSQIEIYGGGGGGTKYVVAGGRKSPWTYRNKEVIMQQVVDIYDILVKLQEELYGKLDNQDKDNEKLNNSILSNNKQLDVLKEHIENILKVTEDKKKFNEINNRIDELMKIKSDNKEVKNIESQLEELISLVVKSLPDKDLEELEDGY